MLADTVAPFPRLKSIVQSMVRPIINNCFFSIDNFLLRSDERRAYVFIVAELTPTYVGVGAAPHKCPYGAMLAFARSPCMRPCIALVLSCVLPPNSPARRRSNERTVSPLFVLVRLFSHIDFRESIPRPAHARRIATIDTIIDG